jgi:hypothetical protein
MFGADAANSSTEVTGPYGEKIFIPDVDPQDIGYRPLSRVIYEITKTRQINVHQRLYRLTQLLEALELRRDRLVEETHRIGDEPSSDRMSEFGVTHSSHYPVLLQDLDEKIQTVNDAINDIGEIQDDEQGVPMPYNVDIAVVRWPTGRDYWEAKEQPPE